MFEIKCLRNLEGVSRMNRQLIMKRCVEELK